MKKNRNYLANFISTFIYSNLNQSNCKDWDWAPLMAVSLQKPTIFRPKQLIKKKENLKSLTLKPIRQKKELVMGESNFIVKKFSFFVNKTFLQVSSCWS